MSIVTGGLSNTSKMPGASFGLPRLESCPTGKQLAQIPGSVCEKCYVRLGFYNMPSPQAAQQRRFKRARRAVDDPAFARLWIISMATLINWSGSKWFRWHDSGDVFCVKYLKLIHQVCRMTPSVRHRLPTKESWAGSFNPPDNLCVRVSGHRIDQRPLYNGPSEMVVSDIDHCLPPEAYLCPASTIRKECGDCRECWDRSVPLIAYKLK